MRIRRKKTQDILSQKTGHREVPKYMNAWYRKFRYTLFFRFVWEMMTKHVLLIDITHILTLEVA